jgi:hypothetical protein
MPLHLMTKARQRERKRGFPGIPQWPRRGGAAVPAPAPAHRHDAGRNALASAARQRACDKLVRELMPPARASKAQPRSSRLSPLGRQGLVQRRARLQRRRAATGVQRAGRRERRAVGELSGGGYRGRFLQSPGGGTQRRGRVPGVSRSGPAQWFLSGAPSPVVTIGHVVHTGRVGTEFLQAG